nr:MAG TPA: hypothetical protein [Caudoviricetes sp.]
MSLVETSELKIVTHIDSEEPWLPMLLEPVCQLNKYH